MTSLIDRRLEAILKGDAPKLDEDHDWTAAELNFVWDKITEPALGLAELIANGELVVDGDNPDYQAFCREVKEVWKELEMSAAEKREKRLENARQHFAKARRIAERWWRDHPIGDPQYWRVYYTTGTFFPTLKSGACLIGYVLFKRREYLGECKHCRKFFIKPLPRSSVCLRPGCRKYDNSKRSMVSQAARREREREAKLARRSRKAKNQ